MRLLLDTHIFLWYITGDQRLSRHFRESIENAEVVFVSVVSIWEAIIKHTIGKLPLPEAPFPWLSTQRELHGFISLPVEERSFADLGSFHVITTIRLTACWSAKRLAAISCS